MANQIDHEGFIALLKDQLPEVASSIDDCCGLLHPEMGMFARATNGAIKSGNVNLVQRYFSFADDIFQRAAPDVENTINVSYLENIDFDGDAAISIGARDLLPSRLRVALIELEQYLSDLFQSRNQFLNGRLPQ